MPMSTTVNVKHRLPDGTSGGVFVTRDIDAPFDEVLMRSDGTLILLTYARGEHLEDPSTVSETVIVHDGFLSLEDGERCFTARYSKGALVGILTGGIASWVPVSGNPWAAIEILRSAFIEGRAPPRENVLEYLDAVLAGTQP